MSTPEKPCLPREDLEQDEFLLRKFQGQIGLSSDCQGGHAFMAL